MSYHRRLHPLAAGRVVVGRVAEVMVVADLLRVTDLVVTNPRFYPSLTSRL